jgi:HAD domain in Swiss Army Knife RNA repair proteins
MKIIFLDIDGVLNCKGTRNPRKFPYVIDPVLLGRLNDLVEKTQSNIVLSSTWRLDPIGLLAASHWGLRLFDVCPDMPGSARRDEMLKWLSRHPETKRFAVIDDEDDELDDLPLFQPSAAEGLTDEIADGVAAYLEGRTDRIMRCNKFKRAVQNLRSLFNRDKS